MAKPIQPVRISPDELDRVLARAHAEQWPELALLGPDVVLPDSTYRRPDGWVGSNVFQLAASVYPPRRAPKPPLPKRQRTIR